MEPIVRRITEGAKNFYAEIAEDGAAAGGVLRCTTCKREQPVGDAGDVGNYYRHGWPRCCGYTMKWVTRRLLDEEATS